MIDNVKDKCKKFLSIENEALIGGFITHMVLSGIFTFAIMSLYITSYFHNTTNSNIKIKDINILYLIFIIVIALTIPLGPKLAKKIGIRKHLYLCFISMAITLMISSFLTNIYLFLFFFGILYSVTYGLIYLVPIYNSYNHFP
jgi:MFS family permease